VSYADAMEGIKEALQRVEGLPFVQGEPFIHTGIPTSPQAFPLVFFYFARAARTTSGQVIANKYVVAIRVCVKWIDWLIAEEQIAPFVNSIPAAFDPGTRDTLGHLYATLGGRVNNAQITDIRSGDSDGWIDIGDTRLRSILFELTVTSKVAVGSGL